MADPLLVCQGLSKNFGALAALADVELGVVPGEIHALIGPNGAGKTTLLSLISGLLAADSGRILLEGRDITRLSMPARARAGLARSFQITSIFPEFTALENTALAVQARQGGHGRFWRRADRDEALNGPAREALALTGLADQAAVPARNLAHGQKRQLELAMAAATAPRLLLLDEPMAGVGEAERRAMGDLLLTLKRHHAILLVEHDMESVFRLADRVSVLVYGRIIATGGPEAIRADEAVQKAYLKEGDDEEEAG